MKRFMVLLLTLCVMLVQIGCQKNSDQSVGGKAVISIWSGESHAKIAYNRAIQDFNATIGKKNNIELVFELKEGDLSQSIKIAAETNQLPEFFNAVDLGELSEKGYIAALNDLPGGQELIDGAKGYLLEGRHFIGDKIYTIPNFTGTQALIYNKDLFKEADLVDENGEAKPPETLDELRSYAKTLTKPEKKQYGIILPLKWSGWFNSDVATTAFVSYGFNGYNPKTGLYDYTPMKKQLETFIGIKNDGSYLPGAEGLDNDPARARFAEGNIGMKFSAQYDVAVFNSQFPAKCDWGVAPLPVADPNNRFKPSIGVNGGYRISAAGVEKYGAEKMMIVYKWLCGDELSQRLYEEGIYLPYKPEVIEKGKAKASEIKGWSEFGALVASGVLEPVAIKTETSGVVSLADNFLNKVWVGEMSIDEALAAETKAKNDGILKYKKLYPEYDASEYIIPDWDVSIK